MTDEAILRVLQGEASAAEIRELNAWRAAAVANELHVQRMARLWEVTGYAAYPVQSTIPTAASIIRSSKHNEIRPIRRRTGMGWAIRGAAAAAAIALILSGVFREDWSGFVLGAKADVLEVVASPSEGRTVELPDGSIVHLGPGSRLLYEEREGTRYAKLSGQAFFGVSRRPSAFVVQTARGDTRVLGTRFGVEVSEHELRVMVVEGKVSLRTAAPEPVDLAAGQVAITPADGATAVAKVEPEEMAAMLDWMEATLVFHNTPLLRVAREIEHHYGIPIEIEGSEIRDRTVVAWFDDVPLEDVLAEVCRITGTRCLVHPDRVTIMPEDLTIEMR